MATDAETRARAYYIGIVYIRAACRNEWTCGILCTKCGFNVLSRCGVAAAVAAVHIALLASRSLFAFTAFRCLIKT